MLFKKKHIALILEGKKTQTRRKSKKTYKVGGIYGIRDQLFKKNMAYILITRRFRERLGDISTEDLEKEGFKNIWEFQQAWTKINGSWDPDKVVTAYEFKLLPENKKEKNHGNPTV